MGKGVIKIKCKICQGALVNPTYRQLFPFVNFPAHSTENWEECKQHLLKNNFRNIYHTFPKIVELGGYSQSGYVDIVEALTDPTKSFQLVTNLDKLEEYLAQTFPDAVIAGVEGEWYPRQLSLDTETYRKLIAIELETNHVNPKTLQETTKEVVHWLGRGKAPLQHPLYYGFFPASRSSQIVRVPDELVEAVTYPWIARDFALERILTVFAEEQTVSNQRLDIAFAITKDSIKPSTIKRRIQGTQDAVVTISPVPGLPSDRREAIKKSLAYFKPTVINEAKKIELNEKKTSIRIDADDKLRIDRIAKQYNVPAYKLTTALLLYANKINA